MADYSKACPHERTEDSLLGGKTYCLDCGEDVSLIRDRVEAPSPDSEKYQEILEATGEQRAEELIVQDMGSVAVVHEHLKATGSIAPIDTSELGPIKIDYATAVGDAKALNWRRIPHGASLPMPLDKAWFAAWREMPWGGEQAVWKVERVPVGGKCPALAVWWSDDVLGVPPCND